jgi:cell division protein FtsW
MSAWTQTLSGWFTSRGTARSNPLPVRLGGRGSFSATGSVPQVRGFDQPLVWVVVALLLWGLVMVYSASIAMPDNPKFARYTHTYFPGAPRDVDGMAFVAALVAFQIPMAAWEKAAPWLFVGLPGTADRGADPRYRQGGERCAALDLAWAVEFPAFGTGQVRGAVVRR